MRHNGRDGPIPDLPSRHGAGRFDPEQPFGSTTESIAASDDSSIGCVAYAPRVAAR